MREFKFWLTERLRGARAWMNDRFDAKWNNDPFGDQPHASADEYLRLFEKARSHRFEDVEAFEAESGFAIDRAWLDELALHTQIVKKRSDLIYIHGRYLYSALRQYIAKSRETHIEIAETGTARGFSAICMMKAVRDANITGRVITLDVLPHNKRQFWNCIDDHEGKKSRSELLRPWSDLTRDIVFLQGDTLSLLPRIGFNRINFAFLDAQHIKSSVLQEFGIVSARQRGGDMIFFDDVTPSQFPGVVQAVEEVVNSSIYEVRKFNPSPNRGYALATHSGRVSI